MRRLLLALPFAAVILIAAVGPVTLSTALTIAGILMVVSPVALKYAKLDGSKMVLLSMAVAAVVAVAAGFLSGELKQADFTTANLYVTMGALWAVQQAVFQLFKNNKTFGKYLV
jgi:hypothetical protein